MSKAIWKYRLPIEEGAFTLNLPKRATVLSVGRQADQPHLWVMVEPELIEEPREFYTAYTGVAFDPTGLQFIGTIVSQGTRLVFHYFERRHK